MAAICAALLMVTLQSQEMFQFAQLTLPNLAKNLSAAQLGIGDAPIAIPIMLWKLKTMANTVVFAAKVGPLMAMKVTHLVLPTTNGRAAAAQGKDMGCLR